MAKKNKKQARPPGAIRHFLLKHVDKHPRDLVAVTKKHFSISQVAVLKQLNSLREEGLIKKRGQTRNTEWLLAPKVAWTETLKVKGFTEHDAWDYVKSIFPTDLSPNVMDIVKYGFTEMVNNVIDHANASRVRLEIDVHAGMLSVSIGDNGIGIFRKIQEAFCLSDPRESILELTKGKVTTDRTRHSGEGLFFTSRAFDRFELFSRGLVFTKDNLQDDWLIDSREDGELAGTTVRLSIRKKAPTILQQIYDQYADPETFNFNKTYIVVELAKKKGN